MAQLEKTKALALFKKASNQPALGLVGVNQHTHPINEDLFLFFDKLYFLKTHFFVGDFVAIVYTHIAWTTQSSLVGGHMRKSLQKIQYKQKLPK